MENFKETYLANSKNVEVKISDGSMIKGRVNIGEHYQRLSDLFRHSNDNFIVVVPEEALEIPKKVYFINKTYIIWAGAED
jgi:hypothetical protein